MDWKLEFNINFAKCEYESAVKVLRKIILSGKYEEMSTLDKMNINYRLSACYNKMIENDQNNRNLANDYIEKTLDIINSNGADNYIGELCRTIWLKVNINRDSMSEELITEYMIYISNLYKKINDVDNSILAVCNIYSILKDGKSLYDYFFKVINIIKDLEYVKNSILEDLKSIDQELYIKANQRIVNKNLKMIN